MMYHISSYYESTSQQIVRHRSLEMLMSDKHDDKLFLIILISFRYTKTLLHPLPPKLITGLKEISCGYLWVIIRSMPVLTLLQ